MNDLITKEVQINGGTFVGVFKDDKIYTPLRKFCDFLGVNFSSQLKKIKRDETLLRSLTMVKITTVENSIEKQREMLMIDISFLPLWLAGIKANQCREEVRENLIKFKLEAKDILAEAFLGKRELVNKDYIRKMDYDRAIVFIRAMMNNLKSNLLFEKTEMEQRIKELDRTGLTSKMEVYIDDGEIKILQDAD